MFASILLLLAMAGDPVPGIRVPDVLEPQPLPSPVEPPKPVAVPKLTTDLIYVIDSDVEAIVTASPAGVVKVVGEAGPLRMRGKFIDGNGKIQTKTFGGKFIYTVEPLSSGRCEVIVIPVGVAKESQIVRRTIDVDAGEGPQPPPKPIDPPVPNAPIAGDGFKVLIVFEATQAQQLPAGQQSAIYGKATRDYLNSKCPVGPDGKTKEWRIYDKDTVMDDESKVWQDAMKRPRTAIPWIVISDGKTGFEGPLPATEAAITELLTKYGK